MKTIALRIDVDTLRGTSRGVPALCEILAKHRVRGTFYFSVGPDNMGRHLWRLLKPAFLWKMLRTDAAGLYGPEIVLMGTAWPGPRIGKRCRTQILEVFRAGHEIGFHAWDHHKSQAKLTSMSSAEMIREFERGLAELAGITGEMPATSASPGWRTNDRLLEVKASGTTLIVTLSDTGNRMTSAAFTLAGACLAQTFFGDYTAITIRSGDRDVTFRPGSLVLEDESATLDGNTAESEDSQ